MKISDLEQGSTFKLPGVPRTFIRLEQQGENIRVVREDRGISYLSADLEVVVETPVVPEVAVIEVPEKKPRRNSKGRYIK